MYEKYFGFNRLPFSITPDPRFFYENSIYREAMASVCYGIKRRKGFIVVTGEPGTGKTRLVKDFMQRAEVTIRSVFITNPKLTVTELLQVVLNELGIVPSKQERLDLTLQLKEYLVEQLKKNHFVAFLVDEAQQLSNELLEEFRLLSNLETNEVKLVQIIFVGQPELEERLDQPELRQLRQRIALRCRLVPLKDQEVSLYIQARLKTAGLKEAALFDPEAVAKIALYSNGIPRLINVICDSALVNCYALSKKNISADIIEEVARDLQLSVRPPNQKLNANHQNGAQDAGRIIKEFAPLTSVSQRPLAEEIQDVFTMGNQRHTESHWRRSLTNLVTGFIFGVLAAAGFGANHYSQLSRDYLSEITTRIWDETNWRETLNAAAVKLGVMHEGPAKELKDVQPMASETPLSLAQELEESGVEANATPILEPRKFGSSPAADAPDRPLEKQTVKINAKNEESVRTATIGTNKKAASDRLESDIHRAIAKRAIRGVQVTVIDGTVFLSGRVDTENQRLAATKAASDVPGVKYIRDQIIVNDDFAS